MTTTRTTPATPSGLIGIFDSGVGGLSVLRALHLRLPGSPLLYVADSGHAPYGDRDPGHVRDRSRKVVDHLVAQGAQLMVVACNTATAWAIDELRTLHPALGWVGVEPGVKPAALASTNRRIAVMATPSTLSSARYADLVARHAPGCEVVAVPCAGLAAAIEQGEQGREEVDRLLDRYCTPLSALGVDTVVLGCTHYPFVADRIAARLPVGIRLLDTADAVARRAVELLPTADGATAHIGQDDIRLQTTGAPEVLARMARTGLGRTLKVDPITV